VTSSSDEGEYETRTAGTPERESRGGKGEKGRRKVCSLPDLSSTTPALNGHSNGHDTQYYALEIAFRSRKSVCVETLEYLQVYFCPHNPHNCQGLVSLVLIRVIC